MGVTLLYIGHRQPVLETLDTAGETLPQNRLELVDADFGGHLD